MYINLLLRRNVYIFVLTDALVMFQYVSMLSGSCRADVSIMLGDVAVLSRRRLSGVPVVS